MENNPCVKEPNNWITNKETLGPQKHPIFLLKKKSTFLCSNEKIIHMEARTQINLMGRGVLRFVQDLIADMQYHGGVMVILIPYNSSDRITYY